MWVEARALIDLGLTCKQGCVARKFHDREHLSCVQSMKIDLATPQSAATVHYVIQHMNLDIVVQGHRQYQCQGRIRLESRTCVYPLKVGVYDRRNVSFEMVGG